MWPLSRLFFCCCWLSETCGGNLLFIPGVYSSNLKQSSLLRLLRAAVANGSHHTWLPCNQNFDWILYSEGWFSDKNLVLLVISAICMFSGLSANIKVSVKLKLSCCGQKKIHWWGLVRWYFNEMCFHLKDADSKVHKHISEIEFHAGIS